MSKPANVPERFLEALTEDERPVVFTRARVPRFGTRRTTTIGVHLIVEAVDLIRNRRAMRSIRARGAALGFPLDRRMAMLVTTHRLLIWTKDRSSTRAPVPLGDLARPRIASATLPYVSPAGWRTVVIHTTDGLDVRFQVDRDSAEAFAAALNNGT